MTGWQVLWDSDEVIWYSQRSDWGNLYLYDLQSGEPVSYTHLTLPTILLV